MQQTISGILSAKQKGFTLIELAIVIVVIVILTTISALGMTIFLKDGRDSERATKITILSSALEKYYDKNGEYPSCDSISGSLASSAAVLDGIDEQSFKSPNIPEESVNSITCLSADPTENLDTFNYSSTPAVGSSAAMPNFSLKYYNEGEGSVVTVTGRRGN